MRIKMYEQKDSEFLFRIMGENGEEILVSQAYSNKSNCKRAIKDFITAMPVIMNRYYKYHGEATYAAINENVEIIEYDTMNVEFHSSLGEETIVEVPSPEPVDIITEVVENSTNEEGKVDPIDLATNLVEALNAEDDEDSRVDIDIVKIKINN